MPNNMRNDSSKQKELNSLIYVLRAIIQSRKQPCPLLSIMKDYSDLECRQLPYRDFGFKNPAELFMQSGEFVVSHMYGKAYISTKTNCKSEHIVDLVRQQRSTGRPSNLVKPAAPPRRSFQPKSFVVQQRSSSSNVKSNQHFNEISQSLYIYIHQSLLQQNNEIEQHFNEISQSLCIYIRQLLLQQKNEIEQHWLPQLEKLIKDELEKKKKQLEKLIKDELEKQEKQLELNFEKEKKALKEECLAEQKSKERQESDANNKNTASNSVTVVQKDASSLEQDLKWVKDRLRVLEESIKDEERNLNEEASDDIDFISIEKEGIEELRQIKERLMKLSFDTGINELLEKPMKTNQSTSLQTTNIKKAQQNAQPKTISSLERVKQQQNPGLPPDEGRHRLNAMRPKIKEALDATTKNEENPNLRPILGQKNNNLRPILRPLPIFSSVQNQLKLKFDGDRNEKGNGNAINKYSNQSMPKTPLVALKTETATKPPPSVALKTGTATKPPPSVALKTTPPIQKQQNILNVSTQRKAWKFDPQLDPCTSISLYCNARKYVDPKYNVFRSKQGLYDCQLVINSNTIYSTYPLEYTSEAKARLACAEKAIEQIQIVEERNLLPTFPNDREFLNVLYNELLIHSMGIISDKLPEWFVDKFGYTLPENWFMLIKSSARFIIEDGIRKSTFIILANEKAVVDDDDDDVDDENISDLEKLEPFKMELLILPWSEKAWNLYITHCVSTTEIWACLLDADHNERVDALMSDLNDHMAREKIRPDVIAPKHIYVVETRSTWQRVRVESVDKENQKTLCFYIDYGDTEYLAVNELYLCEWKYLCMPPQAVPFSLFGLDDLSGNPNAIKYLKDRLLYKPVIGEVVTKKAEFETNGGTIQMIMFDTSTDDDINLNLLLQEEICSNAQPPQLKSEGTTPVNITNIDNDNGDISLQIINADLEYLNETLRQIVESKLNRERHCCSPKELLKQQLLLVNDEEYSSTQWYRAKLIDMSQVERLDRDPETLIDVIYVDYNIKRRIHISDIYRLESLSLALSRFPSQAVRVKLHNISEFSENIIGRMRALIPQNCQAFVRVDIPGDVPHVTILRRVNAPDMPYCNINDDLRLEIERTKDATLCLEDSPNNSLSSAPEMLKSPNQLFQSLTLRSAPMVPLKISELPKLREYDLKLPLNATFFVNVILASNPLRFTVQPYNEHFQQLLTMMKALQEYSVNNDAYIPADMVEIGQAYAAKKDNIYYRVIAKSRYDEIISVSFYDYGDNGTIRSDHLKVLPLQFRKLPIMGINARIYGIKGKTDVWSKDDVKRFRDLVLGKRMPSFIKATRRDEKGTIELSLDLVDVEGDEDINIRQILLDEERSLPANC